MIYREALLRRRRDCGSSRIVAKRRASAVLLIGALLVGATACDRGTTPAEAAGGTSSGADRQTPQPSSETAGSGRSIISTLDDDFDASHRITLAVPDGYGSVGGFAVLKGGLDETGVSVWVVDGVYSDGCAGDASPLERSPDRSIDGLAAVLASQEGFSVSTPADVTIDGFAGTYMERTLTARANPGRCVGDRFMVWRTRGNGDRWLSYAGQRDLLWILDVDGVPLVIDAPVDADASAEDRAEVARMVASIQIDPR